jgi:hypothetical protein
MKKHFLLVFFIVAIVPVNCTMPDSKKDEKIVEAKLPSRKDIFHQLCQYWEVTDAENPDYSDLYDNQKEGIYNYPGIVFMTDSTFLENPRAKMRYGKFELKGKTIKAQFDDGKKAIYTIEDFHNPDMVLLRVEKAHTTKLILKGSDAYWPNANLNPYNKINSQWRIKPAKEESTDALRERLRECVMFYAYLFQGHAESGSKEISFLGLPCCFNWYQGGISVQNEKKLDKKWINCFYSEEQALQARQMIEDVITKKYDWDTTQKNWMKQIVPVLKQIKDSL